MHLQQHPVAASPVLSDVNAQDADFYAHPHLEPGNDPRKGRLLRVSASVRAGTVLLVDPPYAIIPTIPQSQEGPLICSNVGCSRLVSQGVKCPKNCIRDVTWCNDACRAEDLARHEFECLWLKQKEELIRREEGEYNFITLWHIVRLLAARNLELEQGKKRHRYPWEGKWKRGWTSANECCAYLSSWPEEQIDHWTRIARIYLSDSSELRHSLSPSEMLMLICKEETNTFGLYPKITGPDNMIDCAVPRGEPYGCSLYPRAARFNHSCMPNITHKPDDRGRMIYTAARDISQGEECFITYFDLAVHHGHETRRKLCQEQFQFQCTCDRCIREEADANMHNMEGLPFECF